MTAQLGWISSMAVASAAVLLGLAWFGQLYGFVFGRRAAVGQETAAGAPFGAHVPEPAGTRATAEAPSAAVVPVSAGAAAVGAAPGIAGQPAPVGAPGTAAEVAPAEAPESWRPVRTGSLEATSAPARTAQDLPSLPVRISGAFRRLAAAFLVAGCLARGLAAGRVPWANLYEFAITTTSALVVGLVIIERRRPALRLGLVVPAVAVIMLGLALTVYVPVAPLVPALRSYWLVLHVLAAATSGACFVLAGLVSVIFLVGGRRRPVDAGRPADRAGPAGRAADRVRVPDLDLRRADRRTDLGRVRLGPLLGLGSEGGLGPGHLDRLRRLSARPGDGRLARTAGRGAGRDRRAELRLQLRRREPLLRRAARLLGHLGSL